MEWQSTHIQILRHPSRPREWGSCMRIIPWHQICSFDIVTEFIQSLVNSSSGFTDVHQEVFTDRTDAVEAGFFGDSSELYLRRSEGNPW